MRTAIFHEVGPVSVVTMATYPPQHDLSCVKYLDPQDIVSMIRLSFASKKSPHKPRFVSQQHRMIHIIMYIHIRTYLMVITHYILCMCSGMSLI